MSQRRALSRRIGLVDAVPLGLGAMLTTGVFTALAPPAAAAVLATGAALTGYCAARYRPHRYGPTS